MTSYFWVKLPLKYLSDAAFNTSLTDAQKWRYMQLYMLAKELSADGAFLRNDEQLSMDDIAWNLHLDPEMLRADMETFSLVGLVASNGHGPYLTRFKQEQAPISDADRKAAQRERDTDRSQDGHGAVTARDTESESESDSDSESRPNESDSKESSSSIGATEGEGDSIQEQKAQLCTLTGILQKNRLTVIGNSQIITEDILAELARNYARHKRDPKEVKNPGAVTGMNLARGERASIEWYEPEKWLDYIPKKVLQAVRPDLLMEKSESKTTPSVSGYTNFEEGSTLDADPVLDAILSGQLTPRKAWESVLDALGRDGTAKRLLSKIRAARLAGFADGALRVAVETREDCEVLESRMTGTITHLLAGMLDQPVTVQFYTQEPNAS